MYSPLLLWVRMHNTMRGNKNLTIRSKTTITAKEINTTAAVESCFDLEEGFLIGKASTLLIVVGFVGVVFVDILVSSLGVLEVGLGTEPL